MTNENSEALRLIEWIESDPCDGDAQIVAELRRQFDEIKRLHEANQAMLKALHWIDKRCPPHFVNEPLHGMHREMAHDAGACARAAIANAEGDQNE